MHGTRSLGSVSTFKWDDLSALKTFVLLSYSPHQYILCTFKCDYHFALTYLCMVPLLHTTISLVQFQHPSVMTKTSMHLHHTFKSIKTHVSPIPPLRQKYILVYAIIGVTTDWMMPLSMKPTVCFYVIEQRETFM